MSRKLDEVRIRAAAQAGCGCVIGATPSGETRVGAMVQLGFRPVGGLVPDVSDWFLDGTLNQVMFLLLEGSHARPGKVS